MSARPNSTQNSPARNAAAPIVGGVIVLIWLMTQSALADGECRFSPQRPVTLKTMGPCEFNPDLLSFAGDAAQQAACLTTKVLKFGQLGARNELPAGFAKRVGQPLDLPPREALHACFRISVSIRRSDQRFPSRSQARATTIRFLRSCSISSCTTRARRTSPAATSPDIDHDPGINALARYVCSNKIERAHVFINRSGEVLFAHDFEVPWRATKFEMATNFASALKGLFVHVELIQPRRSEPSHGWLNDFQAPTPGFSTAQYERLALVYIVASVRAGRWLIPAFHAVIDEGIYDKHDDPQNFEFATFDENLEKLLERLKNPPSKQGAHVP